MAVSERDSGTEANVPSTHNRHIDRCINYLVCIIMRAQSIHDRDGNNYRYQRALRREEDDKERKLQDEKWLALYRKASILDQKASESSQKASGSDQEENISVSE